MRSERTEDALDALIDRASRELTSGAPPASLREGVRGRITRPRWAWQLSPAWAAAAVVLVAAVFWGRGWMDRSGDVPTVSAPPTIAESRVEAPRERQTTPIQTPRVTRGIEPVVIERVLEDEDPPIPPIAIDPLNLDTIQIAVDESSEVMPIDIAPLQIEPLLQGQ